MRVKSLRDLVVDGIEDMYSAEMQLTKALPKLAEKASNSSLKEAFQEHLKETENHVKRLEKVFKRLEMSPEEKTCKGIKGIVNEGEELINEVKKSDVMDAALIAAGQKAEHYEISSYGTLINLSDRLGLDNVSKYLKDNLVEEYAADDKLTRIADSEVNSKAKAAVH